MDIPAWNTYISETLSHSTRDFEITKLEGGIINSTVRLTLAHPIFAVPGSPRTWDPPLRSCVLKHAPPHMPFAPDQPLSLFRQTIEARALTFCHEHDEILGGGDMEVPELVFLDEANVVLWMTDLGPMMTLTDYFNGGSFSPATKDEEGAAEEIGRRIGEALGRLHASTLHPTKELLREHWTDPSTTLQPKEEKPEDVGDHLRVLAKRLMQDYANLSPDEAETLSKRIGMDEYVLDPGEHDERALTMGDLWPGGVLLAPRDGDDSTKGTRRMRVAMVDLEFFNAYHPARDIAMLISHMRVHQLEAQYPSDSPPVAITAPKDVIAQRTDGVANALWKAYRPLMAPSTQTKRWRREALSSWGREMIVAGGDFRKDMLSEEGMRVCIADGVACLRAAGDGTDKVEMRWVEEAPKTLRMLL